MGNTSSQEPSGFLQERTSEECIPQVIKEEKAQEEVRHGSASNVAQVSEERQGLLVVSSCSGILAFRVVHQTLKHEDPAQAIRVP